MNNCYLIEGYVGKTSLVYHLASSLDYKVIEVNNVDQEYASIVNVVQEATQSHVIKGKSKSKTNTNTNTKVNAKSKSISKKPKVFTKLPIILVDDLDINVPASLSFSPSNDDLVTSLDVYSQQFEKVGNE